MPDDKLMESLSAEEAWEHRGTILYLRDSPGVRRWIKLLRDPAVPDLGDRQVTVLTGRHNRDLLDLGAMQPLSVDGRREIYAVFLDDPHPAEVASWSGDLEEQLPGIMTAARLRQAWDAYLLQTYLHEVGHAAYGRRNGWGGRTERHEEHAERYAWRALQRLYPDQALLAAVALYWMNYES